MSNLFWVNGGCIMQKVFNTIMDILLVFCYAGGFMFSTVMLLTIVASAKEKYHINKR
jgi:hypothetical protein